jgi:hypothetical protein
MLKMHVADNDVVGKIGRALFARGERHGNQARAFVRHGPGRHRPNRNNKRNCEDKSDEQLAQITPSMNHSIISMLPATEHASIHNISLYWSKDCSGHCRFRGRHHRSYSAGAEESTLPLTSSQLIPCVIDNLTSTPQRQHRHN